MKDVSDADRELAFADIGAAARHCDVEVAGTDRTQLGKEPHTDNPAH